MPTGRLPSPSAGVSHPVGRRLVRSGVETVGSEVLPERAALHAEQGRFTQPDPTGLSAGYAYASSNPVNNSDPTGAFDISDAAGAAISAAFWAAGVALSTSLIGAGVSAIVETGVQTLVDCLFGCGNGLVYTALFNGTNAIVGLLTFGAIDQALRGVGAKSVNALVDTIASIAFDQLSD